MGSIIGVAIFTCFGIFLTVASIKSYDPLGSPIQQGFELVLAPISSTRQSTNLTILDSRYLPRKGYLAVTTDPWSIVVPNRSAPTLQPTSEQAKNHQCFLATNGGPYTSDGTCVGAVIVDGNIVKDHFDGVGFGVTHAPNRTWVIGQVESAEQARALRLQHYVTGFDWLVYNGEDVAMGRNNTTGAVKAPRTAVGIDSEGRLMLLVADGCEKCFRCQGPTLTQVARVLVDQGAKYAINLDGGGSSTLVVKSRVFNHPTCVDLPIQCERPVASVMCVSVSRREADWHAID